MADRNEDFLRRWSRRKTEAVQPAQTAPGAAEPPPELPSLDSLSFESDFKAFMHAKVEESVKRAALKKLFADPRFNAMDGLDVYVDDYTKEDPISQELLARLDHARQTLFGPTDDKGKDKGNEEEASATTAATAPEAPKDHGDTGQDA